MTLSNNNKNRPVALMGTAAIILLIASIGITGAAQLSYQQQQLQLPTIGRGVITSALIADNTIVSVDLRDGAAVRSIDIVDGEVNTADLANNAVTSDKIANGEVKAEDLDPSIELGGGGETSSFSLQVTERSDSMTVLNGDGGFYSLSVQCNSDEVVTGGGFEFSLDQDDSIVASKKSGNGWTVTAFITANGGDRTLTVYAECMKIVPAAE